MSVSASARLEHVFGRLAALSLRPDAALATCYLAGLLVGRWIGDGVAGQDLLWIAAPAVVGLLIRFCRHLTATDALSLAAVHVIFAALAGDAAMATAGALAGNLIAIAFGTATFATLRSAGFISSQVRVAFAAAIASVAIGISAAAVAALTSAELAPATIGVHAASALVGSILILMVSLTFDRESAPIGGPDHVTDGPPPSRWEHLAAGALVVGLVLASLGESRLEAAMAASVALLWFALRLGLFATAVAAFSFAAALLGLAGSGKLPALMSGSDPVMAELLRYVALTLLSAPSILVASVVHDQQRQRRVFAFRAMHDGLTQLANRTKFLEVLENATLQAKTSGRRFVLLLIDLDHFKNVNDSYGHARGDALLVEISGRLTQSVRSTDVAARIGGDEFAVVAPVRTIEDAMSLAKRLVETVNQACDLDGVRYFPSITVGGVLSPDSSQDPRGLMQLADEALYEAKAAGRNCWRFSSSHQTVRPPVWSGADAEVAYETVYVD